MLTFASAMNSHGVSLLGSAPVSRSKYILDPSVQSSSSYGQSANMFAPQPQTFSSQQPSYGVPYNQPFSQPVSNPMPVVSPGQSSILNPQSMNTFSPGMPPIEVAQSALQQSIQRNPTPPPGWNDPPALKSSRPVSHAMSAFNFIQMLTKIAGWTRLCDTHLM